MNKMKHIQFAISDPDCPSRVMTVRPDRQRVSFKREYRQNTHIHYMYWCTCTFGIRLLFQCRRMYCPLTLALHPRTHEAALIRSFIPHVANAHTPQTHAAQNRIGLLNETACAPHEQALARAHLVRERRHVWSLAMAACSCRWTCSNSQPSFSRQSSCATGTAHTLRQYHAPVNAPFIGLSAPHQLLSASHQCHETETTRQTESRMELIVVRIESVKICD